MFEIFAVHVDGERGKTADPQTHICLDVVSQNVAEEERSDRRLSIMTVIGDIQPVFQNVRFRRIKQRQMAFERLPVDAVDSTFPVIAEKKLILITDVTEKSEIPAFITKNPDILCDDAVIVFFEETCSVSKNT